ncbi:15342_t:CDS:2 [Gigaspora margarita]|uniref:ATP-dependent DNA helicase n=1 Tax=Gigaspora margarita TaxID=4874 RepID=A0ABN7V9P1_GIGMA|nr:15342_t:CDS:2 [Gigaspora margarita]
MHFNGKQEWALCQILYRNFSHEQTLDNSRDNYIDLQQNEFIHYYAEDFAYRDIPNSPLRVQAVLQKVNIVLQLHSKSISDFDLPELLPETNSRELSLLLLEELNYYIISKDIAKISTLNEAQYIIFDAVMKLIDLRSGGILFVDGPTGSGKMYLYECLFIYLRVRQLIALAVAFSGITILLLHGGCTVHLRFKIPISILDGNSTCNIDKENDSAKLLKEVV